MAAMAATCLSVWEHIEMAETVSDCLIFDLDWFDEHVACKCVDLVHISYLHLTMAVDVRRIRISL